MSALPKTEPRAATNVSIVEALEGLSAIHDPGCAAALWWRQPLQSFQDWMDRLDPSQLPRTRMVIEPDGVRDAVRQCCDIAGTPDCSERKLLIDDAAALAHAFAAISSAPYLRLRFDVVQTNGCSKFHIDAVKSRLVCTYRGTGTQYGVADHGREPERVFTAPTGTPLVLRGTLWPDDDPSGLLHRSPPISGTGETRLLLVLDPLDAMIEETAHVFH